MIEIEMMLVDSDHDGTLSCGDFYNVLNSRKNSAAAFNNRKGC